MSSVMWFGVLLGVSELALALFKRARAGSTRGADRGSLRLLWAIIGVSLFLAYVLPANAPSLQVTDAAAWWDLGAALFVMGLVLRWYAILYLGRFFTVDVAIATDHRVIDTGPYRYIRHPSYTGVLMAFIGLGFCLGNWASLAVLVIGTVPVFLWRIRIEEAALAQALGERYREYMRRTRRLIPAVY
jgi:protein-S-isoprenylcysteine O-methyltransferase